MLISKIPTPYQLWVTSLTLYPATGVYRRAIQDGLITGKDDINDIYRKHILHIKETYLNSLFLLLQDYALVGVGISPIIMSFLTHKMTRKLHLHWISINIMKAFFPFFRTCGRKIRKSTRMYKTGWDHITKNKETLPIGSPPIPVTSGVDRVTREGTVL